MGLFDIFKKQDFEKNIIEEKNATHNIIENEKDSKYLEFKEIIEKLGDGAQFADFRKLDITRRN